MLLSHYLFKVSLSDKPVKYIVNNNETPVFGCLYNPNGVELDIRNIAQFHIDKLELAKQEDISIPIDPDVIPGLLNYILDHRIHYLCFVKGTKTTVQLPLLIEQNNVKLGLFDLLKTHPLIRLFSLTDLAIYPDTYYNDIHLDLELQGIQLLNYLLEPYVYDCIEQMITPYTFTFLIQYYQRSNFVLSFDLDTLKKNRTRFYRKVYQKLLNGTKQVYEQTDINRLALILANWWYVTALVELFVFSELVSMYTKPDEQLIKGYLAVVSLLQFVLDVIAKIATVNVVASILHWVVEYGLQTIDLIQQHSVLITPEKPSNEIKRTDKVAVVLRLFNLLFSKLPVDKQKQSLELVQDTVKEILGLKRNVRLDVVLQQPVVKKAFYTHYPVTDFATLVDSLESKLDNSVVLRGLRFDNLCIQIKDKKYIVYQNIEPIQLNFNSQAIDVQRFNEIINEFDPRYNTRQYLVFKRELNNIGYPSVVPAKQTLDTLVAIVDVAENTELDENAYSFFRFDNLSRIVTLYNLVYFVRQGNNVFTFTDLVRNKLLRVLCFKYNVADYITKHFTEPYEFYVYGPEKHFLSIVATKKVYEILRQQNNPLLYEIIDLDNLQGYAMSLRTIINENKELLKTIEPLDQLYALCVRNPYVTYGLPTERDILVHEKILLWLFEQLEKRRKQDTIDVSLDNLNNREKQFVKVYLDTEYYGMTPKRYSDFEIKVLLESVERYPKLVELIQRANQYSDNFNRSTAIEKQGP